MPQRSNDVTPPTRCPLLAVVCVLAATLVTPTASAQAPIAPPADKDQADKGELVEEPGFFGTHFPFLPEDDLAEPVDDNTVLVYLLNILPFGGLWGPLVLLPEEGRPEFGGDVAVPYLVPYLGAAAVNIFVITPLSVVAVMALVFGASGGIPCLLGAVVCGGCGLCLCPLSLISQCWLAPTASVNAWDRAYKALGAAGAVPEPQPRAQPPAQPSPPAQPQPPAPSPPAARPQPQPPPQQDTKPPDEDGWVPY